MNPDLNFVSTDKFDTPDSQGNTSEYFTSRNEHGQIVAQIVRRDAPSVPSQFWGYRMLKPGVGGKAQSNHLRRFGPFTIFDEAERAIQLDFKENA
jgi:hypothetical protein